MRRQLRSVLLGTLCALSFAAFGCQGPAKQDFAEVDVEGASAKEDSQWSPIEMGDLVLGKKVYGNLEVFSKGYHVYRFEGKRGWYVRFQLESRDFQTYLRITTPSGKKLIERGDFLHPVDETYFSVIDHELTETGVYTVMATSIRNMGLFPFGTTEGRYELWTEGDVECDLQGDSSECPRNFECRPDGPYKVGICFEK